MKRDTKRKKSAAPKQTVTIIGSKSSKEEFDNANKIDSAARLFANQIVASSLLLPLK